MHAAARYGKIVSTKAILDKNTNQCKGRTAVVLHDIVSWYRTRCHDLPDIKLLHPFLVWGYKGLVAHPVPLPASRRSCIFRLRPLNTSSCEHAAIRQGPVSASAGYGFVDFDSPAAAQKAVASLKANGVQAQMAKSIKSMVAKTIPIPPAKAYLLKQAQPLSGRSHNALPNCQQQRRRRNVGRGGEDSAKQQVYQQGRCLPFEAVIRIPPVPAIVSHRSSKDVMSPAAGFQSVVTE
ncbi:hypothetical protein CB1_000571002 [Camelus ferus]|nr:hypothetical protein CB1_000571002 [Camelus ferus]